MKKFFCSLLFLFSLSFHALYAQVQTIERLFLQTPRAVLPLLDSLSRSEMLANYIAEQPSVAENAYGGQSKLLTKTAELLCIQLTDVSTWQMRLLPTATHDTLIAVVHTIKAGGASSELKVYDKHWKPAHVQMPQPRQTDFLRANDSLTQQRNQHLASALQQVPIVCSWEANSSTLTYRLSTEGLSLDDQVDAPRCLRILRYRWGDSAFELLRE